MEFEYFYVTQSVGTLEIEDIGNCAIEGYGDAGELYYLIVRTALGMTRVFEYGPIKPDIDILPKTVICNFKRFEYSDTKVKTAIKNFLNGPYRSITQARLVDFNDALNNCVNIIDYMKKEEF